MTLERLDAYIRELCEERQKLLKMENQLRRQIEERQIEKRTRQQQRQSERSK